MQRYWLSWIDTPGNAFTLHWPWWCSGYDQNDNPIYCAAVVAFDAQDAFAIIQRCHDRPETEITERFIESKPDDWHPFCDRFQRADWMMWPQDGGAVARPGVQQGDVHG